MEKEIPNLQEKKAKAARLRETVKRLQALPLNRLPTDVEWDEITGDLTVDELEHLKKLALGYRDRALEPEEPGGQSSRLEEAASAILLWPKDASWVQATEALFRKSDWKGPEAVAFFATLSQRRGSKVRGDALRWGGTLFWVVLVTPLLVGLAFLFWPTLTKGSGISPVQGPRSLQSVFDTQGVKANIQVAQSRLLLFPDATVAEISAWVTFPDHRVDLWEGTVTVLDAQGVALTKREVTFHSSGEESLEPGQGVDVFEQFNAHPFFDKVSGFLVTTRRILAQEANPAQRTEMTIRGIERLTTGYNLKVWVQGQTWADRFASRVHTLSLELENTGLQSFSELQFQLVWRDGQGRTLKSINIRPVSPFRTALPAGARLPWNQETVFDTEVFPWSPGEEPHPTLELKQWR